MIKVEILEQKGYHFLWLNEGNGWDLWMWDVLNEVKDQQDIADVAYGDVLVAGYGLGLLQSLLMKNERVTSLLTVEKHPEVIRACREVFNEIHGTYFIGDFFDFDTSRRFDCVIGDIWDDLCGPALVDFNKFKSKAHRFVKDGGKVLAWGEDFMEWLNSKSTGGQ